MKYLTVILVLASFIIVLLSSCKKDTALEPLVEELHRIPENDIDQEIDSLAFTNAEKALIMNGDSSDTMRVLTIYKISNGDTIRCVEDSLILRSQSIDVRPDSTDSILVRLIDRMYKSVIHPNHPGVGIAAPQVGINRNVIWVQRLDKLNDPFEVYLNPEIISYSSKEIIYNYDGCLSIPGLSGRTDRYSAVCVEYDKLDGSHHTEVVEGYGYTNFTSIIFQHEIDHLNGILFIDRLHDNTKLMSDKEFEEFCKILGEPVPEKR